jgi:transcriptional regulator GlxA family with amidase domain
VRTKKHVVGILLFAGFELTDVCGPLQVFSTANETLVNLNRQRFYEIRLLAASQGDVKSSSQVALRGAGLQFQNVRQVRTLFIPGAASKVLTKVNPEVSDLTAWITQLSHSGVRLAAVAAGVFLIAFTGLLDEHRVVTHWSVYDRFRDEFPTIHLDRNARFIRDRRFWTSSGHDAGMDMALAMVEEDLGPAVAESVANQLLISDRRPKSYSDADGARSVQAEADPRIAALYEYISDNLCSTLGVAHLAERVGMNRRTFARFFGAATGTTPAKAVEAIRLTKARRLIELNGTSISTISEVCGFSSREVMRRAFIRHFQVSPLGYRSSQRFI